jgi:hypothetical protein
MANPIFSMSSNLSAVVKTETELIAQLPSLLPDLSIVVDGEKLTVTQVTAVLQSHVTTIGKLEAARAQLHELVLEQRQERLSSRAIVVLVRAYVAITFGPSSSQAIALGFAPAPPRPPSVTVKAAAHLKALATRAARGIMGKRQRAKIHAPSASPAVVTPTK